MGMPTPTLTPAPIDPALYAAHQMGYGGYAGGMVVDGAGEVYHHGGYDEPYVAGYYDYEFDGEGQGM